MRQLRALLLLSSLLFSCTATAEIIVVASNRSGPIELTREQAEKLLERVGLADKRDAFPRQLSGGQQQRIAIVRSLCMNPQVMLFDEVTAALDPEMVKEVLEVIQGLARDGMTLLIVTHEMAFARAVADRVVFMEAGRILEHNTPEAFFTNPQTARAQQFLEKFSFVSTLPKKIKELELI